MNAGLKMVFNFVQLRICLVVSFDCWQNGGLSRHGSRWSSASRSLTTCFPFVRPKGGSVLLIVDSGTENKKATSKVHFYLVTTWSPRNLSPCAREARH